MSILVLFKILRLFVDTFTADDKYSPLNRDKLTQSIQTLLSQKQKTFSPFFFGISLICIRFLTFSKKRWPSLPMYFRNLGLWKRWLDECLKSHVSEDSTTSNMEDGPKHWSNVQEVTFTIFIKHCEHNSVGKGLY